MDDLLALARAQQEQAKTLLRRRLCGHAVTLAATVAALFVDAPGTYILAVVALAAEAAAWTLRWRGGELNVLAERARRRALITAALGSDPDPTGTATMRAWFSATARRDVEKWRDPDYWSSDMPPGPERLRDSLQESAFWSCRLYRAASRRAFLRLVIFGAGTSFVVLVLVVAGTGSVAETAARVLMAFLGVVITTDELGVKLTYDDAGAQAERAVDRLDHVSMGDLGSALAVFGDYSAATSGAAPIPTSVYGREHDAIAAAWAQRRASSAS